MRGARVYPGPLGMAVVMLVTGCGGTPERTITADDALGRIDGYVQETMRSVPTELKFAGKKVDVQNISGCTKDIFGGQFSGQINPLMEYTASTSSTGGGEVTRFFDAVAAYWKGKSASVDRNTELLTIHPYRDGYRLFVSYHPGVHEVELGGVLDECIWPHGTPRPTDNP